jgi:hypothetical protein
MKSQVGKGAINTFRKVTGLVPEKGHDSQSFFKGADSIQALVDDIKVHSKDLLINSNR